MPVITNLETVKISELPVTSKTSNMRTLATNSGTNKSQALELTAVAEATAAANAAATAAGNAAAKANKAAAAADEARENIQEDLAGKADLDTEKKYVSQFQLDPLYGYQTGAIMGKGAFSSTAEGVLPDGDFGIAVLFTTGADVTTQQGVFLNHTAARNVQILLSNGYIYLQWYGNGYARKEAAANTMYLAVVCYDSATNTPTMWVNGVQVTDFNTEKYPVETPNIYKLGIGNSTTSIFKGIIHWARLLNFYSDTYSVEMWNGGHPESWRVPDMWRNIQPSSWNDTKTAFSKVGNSTVETVGLPAGNGFSGTYDRYENDASPIEYWGAYCSWRMGHADSEMAYYQCITIEYRADSIVNVLNTGLTKVKLAANTGDAVQVRIYIKPGYYGDLINPSGRWLEIRTVDVKTIGCVLDLVPAGLTPTLWRDVSGQGNDVPYVPHSGSPTQVELSYENVGYPDTMTGEAAPTTVPNFVGQTYIDTVNKNIYRAVGTSSAADWKIV